MRREPYCTPSERHMLISILSMLVLTLLVVFSDPVATATSHWTLPREVGAMPTAPLPLPGLSAGPMSPPVAVSAAPAGAQASIIAAIRAAFPNDPDRAVGIAYCESRFKPRAIGAAGERGLFQIAKVHRRRISRMGFSWDAMLSVGPNIAVAKAIHAEQKWRPWRNCARATA